MSREAGVTERRVGGEGDCLLSKLYGWGQGVGVGSGAMGRWKSLSRMDLLGTKFLKDFCERDSGW
jgi:hypothetical protein